MDIFVIVVLIVVIILILKLIGKYNTFVEYLNKVKSSESGIDVYLNQRFDLIPNLVECVKAYTSHEKELLENITKQRTDYSQNKNLKEASKLNNNLNKVMVVAENYPELKASEQFLNLQNNLVKMENQRLLVLLPCIA